MLCRTPVETDSITGCRTRQWPRLCPRPVTEWSWHRSTFCQSFWWDRYITVFRTSNTSNSSKTWPLVTKTRSPSNRRRDCWPHSGTTWNGSANATPGQVWDLSLWIIRICFFVWLLLQFCYNLWVFWSKTMRFSSNDSIFNWETLYYDKSFLDNSIFGSLPPKLLLLTGIWAWSLLW